MKFFACSILAVLLGNAFGVVAVTTPLQSTRVVSGSIRNDRRVASAREPPVTNARPRQPVLAFAGQSLRGHVSTAVPRPVIARISKSVKASALGSKTSVSKNGVDTVNRVLQIWKERAELAKNERAMIPSEKIVSCPGFEINEYFELPENAAESEYQWKCSMKAAGVGEWVIKILIGGAFSIATKDADGIARLSLADLRKHGFIEHDRSLSRLDLNQRNDAWTPSLEKLAVLAFFLEEGSPDGNDPFIMTFDGLVNWRKFVELDDSNNAAQYGTKERIIAIGESALLWELLNKNGKYISLTDLVDFFLEKRTQHWNEVKLLNALGTMVAIRWCLSKDTTKGTAADVLKTVKAGGMKDEIDAELAAWKQVMGFKDI